MERIGMPEGWEDRLARAREAAARLPEGASRAEAERVLAKAPSRAALDGARAASAAAEELAEHLAGAGFDGTDAGRVVWLRLDYTGRLGSLALSPTVDRMSNRALGKAVEGAWDAAEAARADRVLGAERAGAALLARCAPDPRSAEVREWIARSPERFSSAAGDDDVCEAEVSLAGRLVSFRFLVPNATFDIDYEELAGEVSAAVAHAQRLAADRLRAVLSAAR